MVQPLPISGLIAVQSLSVHTAGFSRVTVDVGLGEAEAEAGVADGIGRVGLVDVGESTLVLFVVNCQGTPPLSYLVSPIYRLK